MKSNLLMMFIALAMALPAMASPNADQEMTTAVEFYNALDTDGLLKLLSATAKPSDREYLIELQRHFGKYKSQAKLIDGNLYFVDLSGPINIKDADRGKYRYNGNSFQINLKLSLKENISHIQKAVDHSVSLFDFFVLPEAQAAGLQALEMAAGIYAIGALVDGFHCQLTIEPAPQIPDDYRCYLEGAKWPLHAVKYINEKFHGSQTCKDINNNSDAKNQSDGLRAKVQKILVAACKENPKALDEAPADKANSSTGGQSRAQ